MENTEPREMKEMPVPGPSGATLTATGFKDKIDPFTKQILKRKQKKSQGSSSYIYRQLEEEIGLLPSLDGA